MPAAHISCRHACLLLLAHPDNLRLGETAFSHSSAPSELAQTLHYVERSRGGQVSAPMTPVCSPRLDIQTLADIRRHTLLRSYRADEWPAWFAQTGELCPPLTGPILDSSIGLADVAAEGFGIALLPVAMFERQLLSGRLIRPVETTVTLGSYWLTVPKDRRITTASQTLLDWLRNVVADH
ncbi:hypothetical protein ERN12_12220 [Rhodobacteraceae bacterium]|nr:hypothetical protein ERN12_12220 [Paracoccaceae bacterium]